MSSTTSSFSIDDNATFSMFYTSNTSLENSTSTSFEYVANVSESVGIHAKSFREYDIHIAALWMYRNSWKVVAPLGLLGNFVIILVSLKIKPFNSTSLFINSLAVVDIFVICSRMPMKTVPLDSTMLCKYMWYLYNALPLFSNYILLFWTIERFIAVHFPLRVMDLCTLKRTALAIVVAGLFSFAVNIAWPVSIVLSQNGKGCTVYKDKREFIYETWYKVDTSIFVLTPMIIIFLCNMSIICRLQQSTKRHRQMTSNEESRQKREKVQRSTTIILLSVSFAFLILHTPIAVYNCMAMSATVITDQQVRATWSFINLFGLTMLELQNSVNFYFYFLTGRRYRQATFSIFFPCRSVTTDTGTKPDSTTKITGVYSTETRMGGTVSNKCATYNINPTKLDQGLEETERI